jgi:ABC-type antimicrobial peptide transport system permease subunit
MPNAARCPAGSASIECNNYVTSKTLYDYAKDKLKGSPQDIAYKSVVDGIIKEYKNNSRLFLLQSSRVADLNEIKNVHGHLDQVQKKKLEDMEYNLRHLHNYTAKAQQYFKTDAYKISEMQSMMSMLKVSLVFIAVIFILGGMTMIDQLNRSTFMILSLVLMGLFFAFFIMSLIMNMTTRQRYDWNKYNFGKFDDKKKTQ